MYVKKFLHLIEQFDPTHGDPKWELIDFLKSKGIKVSLVKNTDMLYIDTGNGTVSVTVSNNEEEDQTTDGTYQVDKEVENLASTANSGVAGLAAKAMGTAPQQAKTAQKKRQQLAGKAVGLYQQKTKALQDAIANASKPSPVLRQ